MSRPPLPAFTPESAIQKLRLAEDAWKDRDLPVGEAERLSHWPRGRRPGGHAGLTGRGL